MEFILVKNKEVMNSLPSFENNLKFKVEKLNILFYSLSQ